MQSSAPDVETYLTEVPGDRKVVLARLRELCRAELKGFTEVMAYGMPTYQRGGVAEVAFAERLAGQDMGKGCLRFRRPDRVDFDLVWDLLRATAATPGPVC
ncbi:DUF1801 domain-containing protein [Streptomyces griseoincarnatus]